MDIGFEMRRKLFHVTTGLVFAALVWYDLYAAELFLLLLVIGIPLSSLARDHELPFITYMLDVFERDHIQERFPGRGSLFFLAGALIAVLATPRAVATAAVLAVAVGDAAAHLVGVRYGRHPNPLNPEKDVEGLVAGIVAATVAGSLVLPATVSFILSTIAILVESVEIRVFDVKVDDNMTIPLAVVAGWWVLRQVAGI